MPGSIHRSLTPYPSQSSRLETHWRHKGLCSSHLTLRRRHVQQPVHVLTRLLDLGTSAKVFMASCSVGQSRLIAEISLLQDLVERAVNKTELPFYIKGIREREQ